MTDTGLNHRLRQRSRRAGLMIGVSMALVIAVCIGGFSVIYAGLDDVVGDFISRDPATETPESRDNEPAPPTDEPATEPPAQEGQEAPQPTEEPDQSEPDEGTDNEIQAGFTPTFQIYDEGTIRLRSEPSTDGGDETIITGLEPATPVQLLEGEQTDDGGDVWVQIRIEDGTEGWVLEEFLVPYEP